MLVRRCENFSILILHRMIFVIDNLFEVSLFTSLLAALILRIIIDGIGSTIIKINEFKCGYDNNINITMILSNFGHSRIDTEISWVVILIISIYQHNSSTFNKGSYICMCKLDHNNQYPLCL